MHLKTKLVLTASGLTFAVVLILSGLFLGELLRQRLEQMYANNDVLAHEVLLVTRQAVESGLQANPPADRSYDGLNAAVVDALRSSDALSSVMGAIVRYSPTVQDVSVTDVNDTVLVSTDPETIDKRRAERLRLIDIRNGTVSYQLREVFGRSRVLDISVPLDRNGSPFLAVHVGVRSTFVRNAYAPWLSDALWFALFAGVTSMAASALLSSVAMSPLKAIGEQLDRLTQTEGLMLSASTDEPESAMDTLSEVNRSIDRLDRQIRTREEGFSALQANLDQMLDTLRDGVLLFTAERRAVMVSDAVDHFVGDRPVGPGGEPLPMIGLQLEQIFPATTELGHAIAAAFESGHTVTAHRVILEDGREVQISLDRIADQGGNLDRDMGTLLTLRDTGSAIELERELEVSRRLAAIGRLTAGVGHEVKNPINAMVVHLELLRGKLGGGVDALGAQRHVDVLTDEMRRLDGVVQTLADFSRPMDLSLREQDLRSIVDAVIALAGVELKVNDIAVSVDRPEYPVPVRADAELMRQALLNLVLNAMQAMPEGGTLHVSLRREHRTAVVAITDTGEGIPANLLARIFDLYFTTKPRGSGIGLATTYRIVQLHGGALDVESDADAASPDRGTTFTLRLPISLASSIEVRPGLPPVEGPPVTVIPDAARIGAGTTV